MIYKIIASKGFRSKDTAVYYISGGSKKNAKYRFLRDNLKIHKIKECTPEEAERATKEHLVLYEEVE